MNADGDRLDGVLEALGNPHRREIVRLLGLQPWGISQLARLRSLSLPAIHKHLKILDEAGLIVRHKRGRTTFVTLDPRPLVELQRWLGQFHAHWGSGRAAYDNYVEYLDRSGRLEPDDPSPKEN